MHAMSVNVEKTVVHLARLNAAGWCRWCGERRCSSPGCIRKHAESSWTICPDCDGSEYSDPVTGERCLGCLGMSGLVETTTPKFLAPVSQSASVVDLNAVTL